MRHRNWILAFFLFLCLPAGALAQPKGARTQADISAEADDKFRKGRAAQARGDCKLALEFFRTSQGLKPGRGTLLNIAICEKQLGQIATAMQHFQELLPQLGADDDRRPIVRDNITELKPRMPYLRLILGEGAPAGTTVTYDNAELEPTMIGTDMPVDPGKHVIIVDAAGLPDRRYEVMVEEGKRQTLRIEPGTTDMPTAVTNVEGPGGSKGKRTAGFVVGGIGVAGLVAGGVTGGLALSDHSAAEDACPTHQGCSADVVDRAGRGKTLSIVSTAAFAAGAVGVGLGMYFVLTSGKPEKAPTVGVTFGPDGGRIGIHGEF